jgi:hypothetical protein
VPGDERIFFFVSAAKNAVAFFNLSLSICNRFTVAVRILISSCSALSFPLPRQCKTITFMIFPDPTAQNRVVDPQIPGYLYSGLALFDNETHYIQLELF